MRVRCELLRQARDAADAATRAGQYLRDERGEDCDLANVMAYAWLVLQTPPGSREAAVLDAMNAFCEA